jgi:hypothetical protein
LRRRLLRVKRGVKGCGSRVGGAKQQAAHTMA